MKVSVGLIQYVVFIGVRNDVQGNHIEQLNAPEYTYNLKLTFHLVSCQNESRQLAY